MKNFFLAAGAFLSGIGALQAQEADPAINLSITSPVEQNRTVNLYVMPSNLGDGDIVANSLKVRVTVSSNLEITGLVSSTNNRWTVDSPTTGPSNTYVLRNVFTLPAYTDDSIVLTVRGTTVSAANTINGSIAYSAESNPILGTSVQNSSQGNSDPNNDTSSTNLQVTPSAPLITRLVAFTGEARQCDAVLAWQVAGEAGRYELESSPDGRQFAPVPVEVHQSGPDANLYRVAVAQQASKTYYRLKLTGTDGVPEWSQTVRVLTNCNTPAIAVFPNPVTHVATITGLTAGDQVSLYNALGQQVRTLFSTGTRAALEMQSLATGTYRLVITGADKSITLPVVKTH